VNSVGQHMNLLDWFVCALQLRHPMAEDLRFKLAERIGNDLVFMVTEVLAFAERVLKCLADAHKVANVTSCFHSEIVCGSTEEPQKNHRKGRGDRHE
jgi:hypothetical protein